MQPRLHHTCTSPSSQGTLQLTGSQKGSHSHRFHWQRGVVDKSVNHIRHFPYAQDHQGIIHRQRIAGDMSVNCTPPPPLKVGKFKWNYTFSGGNFPISTVFCNSLSVPKVSQTCKLVKNTPIRPKGPYKLIFKN